MGRVAWRRWPVVALALAIFAISGTLAVPALGSRAALSNEVDPIAPGKYHVGDTIDYVLTVSNFNTTDKAVMDADFTYPDGSQEALATDETFDPGETRQYTRSYTVRAEDVRLELDQESVVSTLRATGHELRSGEPVGAIDLEVDKACTVVRPSLVIKKYVDFDPRDGFSDDTETWRSGGTATWKIVVTNTGTGLLSNVVVNDSDRTFGPYSLPKGASREIEYTETITADQDNLASATAADELGRAVGPVADSACAKVFEPPELIVKKYVDVDGDGIYSDRCESYICGSEARWKVVVTNLGPTPITDITVTDTNEHPFGEPFDLGPNRWKEFKYSTLPSEDTTDVATAQGYDEIGGQVGPVEDWACAQLLSRPELTVKKYIDFDPRDGYSDDEETWYVGEPATWKLVVSNHGCTPAHDVVVKDTNGATYDIGSLLPDESRTYEYAQDEIAKDVTNCATATGVDDLGRPLGTAEDCAAAFVYSQPKLSVTTDVDFDGDGTFSDDIEASYAGRPATWKIVVRNEGPNDVADVVLSDTNEHEFDAPFDLANDEAREFVYQTTVDQDFTNTVSARATDALGGTVGPVSDSATAMIMLRPTLSIEKYVDFDGDGVYSEDSENSVAGATAAWKIVVSNPGPGPIIDITVSDTEEFDFGAPFDLAAGSSQTFTYETTPSADFTNWATAKGTDELGHELPLAQDDASVSIDVEVPVSEKLDVVPNDETGDDATRTVGYWKTRGEHTGHVLNKHLNNEIDLGWVQLESAGEVLGAMWASESKNTDGSRRDELSQARISASKQLVAATLNTCLEDSGDIPTYGQTGEDLLTAARSALRGTDREEILHIGSLLEHLNATSEMMKVEDVHGAPLAPTGPKTAAERADVSAVDCSM